MIKKIEMEANYLELNQQNKMYLNNLIKNNKNKMIVGINLM